MTDCDTCALAAQNAFSLLELAKTAAAIFVAIVALVILGLWSLTQKDPMSDQYDDSEFGP